MLTAQHCIDGEIVTNYVTKNTEPQLFEEPSRLYTATVTYQDAAHDVALLTSIDSFPHAIARLADVDPAVGSDLTLVGSTLGLTFTVSPGTVAGYKTRLSFFSETTGPFLELVSGAWGGNSGGGVFDMRGRLVGLMVMRTNAPSVGFAVHRSTIRTFLLAHGI
jgi:S1-C subfamily serine protease